MPKSIKDIRACSLRVYDAIIDVRSEAEFEEDHIPGAINLPVLKNDERAEIGTLYVQTSRFLARRKGATLVAKNIAHHLETTLSDRDRDFRPLIYCWRGGNRSGAMATIFDKIGWQTDVLEKGYKMWRRAVVDMLRTSELPFQLILLDGETGVGKTNFLKILREQGAQVLCLETLANHKGSIFGGRFEDQPSQKYFESLIFDTLRHFDPARPVFIEAESSKLGRLHVPKQIWDKMIIADRVEIRAPLSERVALIMRDYQHLIKDRERLSFIVDQLRYFHAASRVDDWHEMAKAADLYPFVTSLLEQHYDPLYMRSRLKGKGASQGVIALPNLSIDSMAPVATSLIQRFDA